MKLRAAIAVTALAAAAAASPRPVRADAPADEDPAKREARALLREGVRLLGSGDAAGALALFRSAYAKFPSAKILLDIGSTLKTMGRAADAANAYQRFLDAPDTDAAHTTEVRTILAALDATVGVLAIEVDVADAEIQVGDDWLPAAQVATLRVPPGEFVVRARRPGAPPAEARGRVAAGATARISIALATAPAPARPPAITSATTPATPIAAPADEEIGVRAHAAAPPSSWGGIADVVADGKGRGGAMMIGGLVELTSRVELEAGALIGPTMGAYAGGAITLGGGALRPRISAGVPVFLSSGARVALRAAAGVEWRAGRHLAVVAELGVERYLDPEGDVDATQLVPTLGVHGRL